jgi:hypothetical protein
LGGFHLVGVTTFGQSGAEEILRKYQVATEEDLGELQNKDKAKLLSAKYTSFKSIFMYD